MKKKISAIDPASSRPAPSTERRLSPEALTLFRKLTTEWAIKDHAGQFLLSRALEAFDEMRAAQVVLDSEGVIIRDRFGASKLHPMCQREKEARAHLLAAFKQLNLDLETLK